MKRLATALLRVWYGLFFDRVWLTEVPFTRELARRLRRAVWRQKILGFHRDAPWPVAHTTTISDYRRLRFDPADWNNLDSPGCYFQNFAADITLGKGTFIAPNVGLITAQHDHADLTRHLLGAPITLGESCWVGMGAKIMPGVTLGAGTVVAANAVVTRSFPEGRCVLAGVPAVQKRIL